MSSSSSTKSREETTTVSAANVREVMSMTSREISTILSRLSHIAPTFGVDKAMIDVSILTLNDVIESIHLQFYSGVELIREYRYVLANQALDPWGPSPDNPPMGIVPPDARVRLVVMPNPRQSKDFCDEWFKRLGWQYVSPLEMPDNMVHQAYGSFVSGGFGVERQLLSNPRFDTPVSGSNVAYSAGKED